MTPEVNLNRFKRDLQTLKAQISFDFMGLFPELGGLILKYRTDMQEIHREDLDKCDYSLVPFLVQPVTFVDGKMLVRLMSACANPEIPFYKSMTYYDLEDDQGRVLYLNNFTIAKTDDANVCGVMLIPGSIYLEFDNEGNFLSVKSMLITRDINMMILGKKPEDEEYVMRTVQWVMRSGVLAVKRSLILASDGNDNVTVHRSKIPLPDSGLFLQPNMETPSSPNAEAEIMSFGKEEPTTELELRMALAMKGTQGKA